MESNAATNAQIDQRVFRRLASRILYEERENFKTRKLSPSEMADKIRKLIEFEVTKNDD